MPNFEDVITILDYTLNSGRRRHIAGGLALTAMTLKAEGT